MNKQTAVEPLDQIFKIHPLPLLSVIARFEEHKTKSAKKELDDFGINVNSTWRGFILELSPVALNRCSKIDKFKNSDWERGVREKKKNQGQTQISNLHTESERAETLGIESK